jgi:hypothetical protein
MSLILRFKSISNNDKHPNRSKYDKIWRETLSTLLLIIFLASIPYTELSLQPTIVSILPESYTVPDIGLTFTLNISIQNVNNLYAWEITLHYPNDILNGTTITEGPFLKTGNQPTIFSIIEFNDTYSNTHGRLIAFCSRLKPDTPGISGNGTLATITFKSKSTNGPKTIHLENVKLLDPNLNEIPCTTADSQIKVIPEHPTTIIPIIITTTTMIAIIIKRRQKPSKKLQNT